MKLSKFKDIVFIVTFCFFVVTILNGLILQNPVYFLYTLVPTSIFALVFAALMTIDDFRK